MSNNEKLTELVTLSREIGREDRQLAILGEGNTSMLLEGGQFAVKASGTCLGTLTAADVTVCDQEKVLSLFAQENLSDAATDEALLAARVNGEGKKPSCEALFHAWLLKLPEVRFVGHCHPLTANQVLCSPRALHFAQHRLFPDEVVCCGVASVFVPYADPGLPLARAIRERTREFVEQYGQGPRLILLQNHGIIAVGKTANAVLACLAMASKAAAIFLGAAALGGPTFLSHKDVDRIAGRPDEAYRQRQLKI
jgi:rhamnose utilization protein RhaD (predicted bifunctional aldolase and dehydrogenase)